MRNHLLLGLTLLAAAASPAAAQGPTLIEQRTTLLQEGTQFLIGRPDQVVPDGAGGVLILDNQAHQVLHFDASGAPVGRYGGEGEGPGEFMLAQHIALTPARELLVFATRPATVMWFELETGRLLRQQPINPHVTSSTRVAGSYVVAGILDRAKNMGAALWDGAGGQLRRVGALPPEYRTPGVLPGSFSTVSVTHVGDAAVLLGYEASEWLSQVEVPGGRVQQRFSIPARDRRGVPEDPATAVEEAFHEDFTQVFGVLSALRGLFTLSDGRTVAVHADSEAGEPPVRSRTFVSVLSSDLTQACVDGLLPFESDGPAPVAIEGDQLVVLSQQLVGGALESRVHRFAIDDASCAWVAVPLSASR